MARSVRDLRELVCVSRLTMREDEEDDEDLSRPLTSLSLFEERPSESQNNFTLERESADPLDDPLTSKVSSVYSSAFQNQNHCNNNESQSKVQRVPTISETSFEFKNTKSPLPPVKNSSRPSSGETLQSDLREQMEDRRWTDDRQGFYDDVLQHVMDENVNEWLTNANQSVAELTSWCLEGDNFVSFCNFWLTEFPLKEQVALIKLEISVILDEFAFAMHSAINAQKVRESDVKKLFASLFPEYPQKLCSPRGQYIYLNILDTLSSGKTDEYKRLLSDVRIYTRQSHIAQNALAMRAYILLNLWNNVVKFYIKVKDQLLTHEVTSESKMIGLTEKGKLQQGQERVFQAVRRGNVRVLHYLFRSSFGSPSVKDSHGRSVAFTSVLHNQPRVLKYLLAKHFDKLSLSEPCESGNSALHAAANLNHSECLKLLLQSGAVDVSQKNPDCEGATPLHLAVMQGNKECVELLLKAGADTSSLMNGVSPLQLAVDLGLDDMVQLLQQQ